MAIGFRSFAQNFVSSTSITINVPAGTVDGDVMLMMISTNTAAVVTATGWTLVNVIQYNGSSHENAVYRRVANSEPASYTITVASSSTIRGVILSYTGVDNTTPVQTSVVKFGSTVSPQDLNMITTQANEWMVWFGCNSSTQTSWTQPGGHTSRETSLTPPGCMISDKLFAAIGNTTVQTGTLGTSRPWGVVSIMLNPAASASTVRNRAIIAGL